MLQKLFVGTLIVSLGIVSASAVQAEPISDRQIAQATISPYKFGKVVGKSGTIYSIQLEDGTAFNYDDGSLWSGDYVVVTMEDGQYILVDSGISMLAVKSKYTEMDTAANFNSRIEAINREMEASSTTRTTTTTTRVVTPAPRPAVVSSPPPAVEETSQPVRALW